MQQNFKYLTVSDLEKYRVNLMDEISRLEDSHKESFGRHVLQEDKGILEEVDREILERTLLGATTDGGCSN